MASVAAGQVGIAGASLKLEQSADGTLYFPFADGSSQIFSVDAGLRVADVEHHAGSSAAEARLDGQHAGYE